MVKLNGNPYRKNVDDVRKKESIYLINEQNKIHKEILDELKVIASKISN